MQSPRIVAEIGTAHGGDIARAHELIAAAKEAGADTAKFQLVIADEILHPNAGAVELPGGSIPLFRRFQELEREPEFFLRLKERCDAVGIRFLCTPFGLRSARILRGMGVAEMKIASPELNHFPLLREVAGYRKPLILSAGVATLSDIAEALAVVGHASPVSVLHCITSYPAPEEEYNVRLIRTLNAVLGVPVGISDHSLDPLLVPVLSTLMGAVMIEKHITLSRDAEGLDDPIALEPSAFARMVAAVHSAAQAVEDGPQAVQDYQRQLGAVFGNDRIGRVLGNGVKRLAPSEERNYGFTNRGIHAVERIRPGQTLNSGNVAILRSEKNLPPGLHPRYWEIILGVTVQQEIPAGHGVNWQDLLLAGTVAS